MTAVLRIKDWSRYMHADCKRAASNMPWVKAPTSHDGIGFLDLMEHENGTAHFGCWMLILQTAAKCPIRGTLISDGARAIGARELYLKTRGRQDLFQEAIERLIEIGWLEMVEIDDLCKHLACNMQDTCKQDASNVLDQRESKSERESESKREKKQAPSPPLVSTRTTTATAAHVKVVGINLEQAQQGLQTGSLLDLVGAFGCNTASDREADWRREAAKLNFATVAAILGWRYDQGDPIREPSGFRDAVKAWKQLSGDERQAIGNRAMRMLMIEAGAA